MNTATRTTINVRLHDHAIDMMWWVMRFVNVECHFDRVCVYVCYFRESAGDVTCVVGSHWMSHATACIYCTAESCYKYTVAPNYSCSNFIVSSTRLVSESNRRGKCRKRWVRSAQIESVRRWLGSELQEHGLKLLRRRRPQDKAGAPQRGVRSQGRNEGGLYL